MKLLLTLIASTLAFTLPAKADDVNVAYNKFLSTASIMELDILGLAIDKTFIEILNIKKSENRGLDIIKTFFPYKLPEDYKGKNNYLNCYPAFEGFINTKNINQFIQWRDCLSFDFGDSIPAFHKDALVKLILHANRISR